MKHMSKLLALALAVVMVLSLGITALAAETGSITINNASVGKTYKVYKIFDATVDGDKIVYYYTTSGGSDTFLTALQGDESPFNLVETTTVGTYNVTLKIDKDGDAVSTWLAARLSDSTLPTAVRTVTVADDITGTDYEVSENGATVKFTGLDYGYYYITTGETGGIATIDSVDGTNVIVQDKNQTPAAPDTNGYKVIVDNAGVPLTDPDADISVSYGDTVYYTLRINATNYATEAGESNKQIIEYVAHDVLGEGLTNLTVDKVKVNDTELNTGYTVTNSTTDGCTAEIAITWANADANSDTGFTSIYPANSTIEIDVKATVDTDATIGPKQGTSSNLTNKGSFSWKYADGSGHTPDPDDGEVTTVTSETYAIAIYKTDAKGTVLSGANFTIKDADGNQIYVKETITDSGVYEFVAAVADSDTPPTDASNTVVSPDSGIIIVKGVAAGTYTLTETVAPDNYNLLLAPETVEAGVSEVKTITIYKDSEGNIVESTAAGASSTNVDISNDFPVDSVNIVNNVGTELPSTGGIGTTIFYVVGAILVLGAGVLLITKKRMSNAR